MSETLGPYHLMHKVDEDVLGEIHCAGKDDDRRGQIVLIRLFERHCLDSYRFLEHVAGRQALLQTVNSPHLAASLQLGVADGRAFSVHPYLAGRTLSDWIHRATAKARVFPLGVALLVVGRIASGLQAAFRKTTGSAQTGGLKLLHGFLTPHLVMVTGQGGVKLLSLDIAPALRDFRGTAAAFQQILPYLAPESPAAKEPHPSDDVYSLGALLYEMLTLKPLRSGLDLRRAELGPRTVQDDLRYFLQRSVAPRFRRLQSVVEWLQELKALVVGGDLAATPRDLAAFLASLDEPPRPRETETTVLDAADVRAALATPPAALDHDTRPLRDQGLSSLWVA